MVTLILAILMSVTPVPVEAADAAGVLISNAVTIEGTASLEVEADTLRLEFPVTARASTAADALAKLPEMEERFKSAVRSVAASGASIEFTPPALMIAVVSTESGRTFEASRKGIARISGFPRDEERMFSYVSSIIAAVADEAPMSLSSEPTRVLFEIANVEALEARLAKDALKDAKERASTVAEILQRGGLRIIRAAHFPAGVTVDGKAVPFSQGAGPVVTKEAKAVVTYTVKIAYALEN